MRMFQILDWFWMWLVYLGERVYVLLQMYFGMFEYYVVSGYLCGKDVCMCMYFGDIV